MEKEWLEYIFFRFLLENPQSNLESKKSDKRSASSVKNQVIPIIYIKDFTICPLLAYNNNNESTQRKLSPIAHNIARKKQIINKREVNGKYSVPRKS